MPKPSSASASFPIDRGEVARELYVEGGARPAAARCEVNTRFGQRDLGAAVAERLALRPGERVADVGCGSGAHLARFAASVAPDGLAFGVDFSAGAMADVAARGLLGIVASGDRLPLRAGALDAIACSFAVYYLDDPRAAVHDWLRTLRPGGRLVVAGPAHANNAELYAFHRDATGHPPSDADRMALGYVADQVVPLLHDAGFADVAAKAFANRVTFPDGEAFLDYWTDTSLFARTPGARRADGARCLAARGHVGELVVHKLVTLVSARRPG